MQGQEKLVGDKTSAIERQQGSSSSCLYANHPEGVSLSLRVVKKKFKVESKCGMYVSSAWIELTGKITK